MFNGNSHSNQYLEHRKKATTFYKWGIGDMSIHMGYVKNGIVVHLEELQTLFKHGIFTFSKLCPTKRM